MNADYHAKAVGSAGCHLSVHTLNLHRSSAPDLSEDPKHLYMEHEYYPFKASLPVPLGSPARVDKAVVNGVDPYQTASFEKDVHRTKCQRFLRKCDNVPLDHIESLKHLPDGSVAQINPNLASLAQLISQDPHPVFDEEYNSYYGNTMTICNVEGHDLVVYPIPHSEGLLKVVQPNYDSDESIVCKTHKIQLGMDTKDDPIYQVQSSGDTVLIRMKNKCILFKLQHVDDELHMQPLYSEESNSIFITSCLNPFKNEIATLTSDGFVKTRDVTNTPVKGEVNVDSFGVDSSWGSIHYHDENVLMFCDRKSITLRDLRTPSDQSSSLYWDSKSVTGACDSIFSSTKGGIMHYVCTNHFLLSLDIRQGWHQRWAHGLTNSPSLLSLTSKEFRNDSLLIGSTVEVVNVYNAHSTNFDFEFIKMPPFQLPSVIETLHKMRLKGHCLSPSLTSRFSMSLVGLASIRKSCKVDVFLSSSVGDLFSQQMYLLEKPELSTPEVNEKEIRRIDKWSSECLEQYLSSEPVVVANELYPNQDLRQLFENTRDGAFTEDPKIDVERYVQPWSWTKEDIERCRDSLAPGLLSCWNMEDDDWEMNFEAESKSNNYSDEDSSDSSLDDINQRIQDWLNEAVQAASEGVNESASSP